MSGRPGQVQSPAVTKAILVADAANTDAVNATVLVMTPDRKWIGSKGVVLSMNESVTQRVAVSTDVSAFPPPDGATDEELLTIGQVKAGKKTKKRYVKIVSQHLSEAMSGSYFFTKGRETKTESQSKSAYPASTIAAKKSVVGQRKRRKD